MPQLSVHAPLFDLTLYEENGKMLSVDWGWSFGRIHSPFLDRVKLTLDRYFDGEPISFKSIPVDLECLDPNDQKVLSAIRDTSYGHVQTYHQLSQTSGIFIDDVVDICLHNPLPILIPCHRIVDTAPTDGFGTDIGDYVGATDMPVKRELLILEGALSL